MKRKSKICKTKVYKTEVLPIQEIVAAKPKEKQKSHVKEQVLHRITSFEKRERVVLTAKPLVSSRPVPAINLFTRVINMTASLAPAVTSKRVLVQAIQSPYGIWSDMRGEGRWLANAALLFKKMGLEVDTTMEGNFVDGYEHKQCGINILKEPSPPYDLYFGYSSPDTSLDIKKSMLASWWPTTKLAESIPTGTVIVHPCSDPTIGFPDVPGVKVFPNKYIDKFEEPRFDNKSLVWTTRGIVSRANGPNAPGGMTPSCLSFLKVSLKAAQQGYHVTFLCFSEKDMFPNSPVPNENPLIVEAQKIVRQLQACNNVKFYGNLPNDQFVDIIKASSIGVRLEINPGFLEDILLNSVAPLLFSAFYYPQLVKVTNIPGIDFAFDANNISEEVVEDRIFKLLTDKDYYHFYYNSIRNNTRLYTIKEAMVCVQEILDILF